MSIKMVALDLDGTTLNSNHELTDRTRKALEAAAEQGVYIVVSTGRSFNSLPPVIKTIKGLAFAITSNGSHINMVSTGESIYDDYIHPDNIERIIELADKHNCGLEVFVDGQAYIDEATYNDIKENGSPFRNAEYVLWSRKPVPDIGELLRENMHKVENCNFCFDGVEHLETARADITSVPNAQVTSSFANNLEIGGSNTSKKTALIELMKRLDIDKSELMCCGDAPNDIQMLELAGIGVAMENGWGGIKEHADYVTASCDDDGVAKAIEKFVLKK
ncbi:MAG: HAD family hydrolase [Clostridiales bacterium]|nr:HAD family hydrolase [Candidatus Crickella equi]